MRRKGDMGNLSNVQANHSGKVILLLERFQAIYKEMLQLEREKRTAIIKRDLASLEKIIKLEEDLLQEINELENQQKYMLKKQSAVLELSKHEKWATEDSASKKQFGQNKNITLTSLLKTDFFDSTQKEKISALQTNLQTLLNDLQQQNKNNEILLQETQQLFHEMLEVLTVESNHIYQQDGKQKNSKEGKPVFVDLNC